MNAMLQTQRDFYKAVLADKALTLTDSEKKRVEKQIAYCEKTLAEHEIIGFRGKFVWIGTKDAIKDTK